MYEPGLAKIAADDMDPFDVEHGGADVRDWRGPGMPKSHDPRFTVVLPHSCDYWVVGGREQVKAMIADLTALLDRL